MTIMTGTATTPLMTALQYKAWIGSIGLRVIAAPSTADTITTRRTDKRSTPGGARQHRRLRSDLRRSGSVLAS